MSSSVLMIINDKLSKKIFFNDKNHENFFWLVVTVHREVREKLSLFGFVDV